MKGLRHEVFSQLLALCRSEQLPRPIPIWSRNNVSAWFAFFDGLPLGWLQFWALDLDGVISKRHALGEMIYERMHRRFGAFAVQPDLLDDRRGAA